MKTLRIVFFIGLCALSWSGLSNADNEFTQWLFGNDIKTSPNLESFSKDLVWGSCKHFLAHNLCLFDAATEVQECHMSALMVVRFAQDEHFCRELEQLTDVTEILNADDDTKQKIKFLALSLLLSFVTAGNDRGDSLEKLLECNSISKKIKKDLRSGKSTLICQAKKACIEFMASFFNKNLSGFIDGKRWEDLGFSHETLGVKILPKFPGIWCFLKELKHTKNVWMVVRCKNASTNPMQTLKFLVSPDQKKMFSLPSENTSSLCKKFELDEHMPVIVIEGVSAIESPWEKLLDFDPEIMQLANAAAWMKKNQPKGVDLVPEKLRDSFKQSLEFAKENGLGSDKPQTFSIEHMFPDTLGNALGDLNIDNRKAKIEASIRNFKEHCI